MEIHKDLVEQIYKLRHNFILIGLTGRTGSGCSTVAGILGKTRDEIMSLKSNYKSFNDCQISNDVRKNRIIHHYIENNWLPFTVLSASNIILYYALLLDFDNFVNRLFDDGQIGNKLNTDDTAEKEAFRRIFSNQLKSDFETIHEKAKSVEEYLKVSSDNIDNCKFIKKFILELLPEFRAKLNKVIAGTSRKILGKELQTWGNRIRKYDTIDINEGHNIHKKSPSCLAHKINQIIKIFRYVDKNDNVPTLIVIDALRNPFEILYFRERYSAFYTMSVNTEEHIRHEKLINKGVYTLENIIELDYNEGEKKDFWKSYESIDINKCIELSDIYITHDGEPVEKNKNLINQIFTYIALIFHPGLIPPSPLERVMQVALTAKLNSGCLSRQVGAAVTNEYFSVQSIGWNTVAEGQTPCSIRCLNDLCNCEDEHAYSKYERNDVEFRKYTSRLLKAYQSNNYMSNLKGLNLSYCFKDVYTTINVAKQKGNQVHTRSLHAEENAFLQLAKYGTQGIKGGKLFTTASCCELCGKKAYQLGITEIYYIDSYPGITKDHILECGDQHPKTILFHGAVGRAYISLYNPFLPMKDEIEALTGISVKKLNETNTQEKSKKQE